MAESLKDLYTLAYIQKLASALAQVHAGFDRKALVRTVMDAQWQRRELKARMHHITLSIHLHLALPYREALPVLKAACPAFGGYHGMFFPDYVQQFGLANWQDSMPALEWFTQYSSSEFAVRPFIERDEERMMAQMQQWATHSSEHVRRLASEGCRPRLPWASQLPALIHDPSPILPILERLRADQSLYVRKSVANNLNDIAKDHPQQVLALTKRWRGQHPHTDWILKRGCRTLLKQGDSATLALFDYPAPEHVKVAQFRCSPQVQLGQALQMQLALRSLAGELGLLRIEYEIGFVRTGSKLGYKVFQWSEKHHTSGELVLEKQQPFVILSTRKLYPGQHIVRLKVNGFVLAETVFELL